MNSENMYGLLLLPFVNHEIVVRLSDGILCSPYVAQDGAYMVMSLEFKDLARIRSVVVGADGRGKGGRVAAQFNVSLNRVPHVSSLVVEKKSQPAEILKRGLCSGSPVVVKHMDCAAVLELVQKASHLVLKICGVGAK